MGSHKVVFCGTVKAPFDEMEGILARAEAHLVAGSPKTEEEVVEWGREAEGMIIHGQARITQKVVRQLRRCRVISKTGVGVDGIDVGAATAMGILVTNAPGISTSEVSDHTMALVLACARRIVRVFDLVREGRWREDKRELVRLRGPIYRLEGKTLGIVGLGRIGKAVAKKAQAFGLRTVAFDPFVSLESAAEIGVIMVGLDQLLRESDFITIHAPLQAETRGLMDKKRFGMMKPSAYLINAARGPIVDATALYEALAEKRIAGAALDVTDPEPLPADSPFYHLDNVIITAHTAANSEESVRDVCLHAAENVAAVFRGEEPPSPVNPEALMRGEAPSPGHSKTG